MPHIKLILCSGICLLNATLLTAQKPPDTKSLQRAVGYQLSREKQWSMKQQPANSAFYKINRIYTQHHGLNFSTDNVRVSTISYPAFFNSTFTDHSFSYSFVSAPAPNLQSFLKNRRQQDYKWQRQNWWRDPSKGAGTYLLKDIILKDRSFIRL